MTPHLRVGLHGQGVRHPAPACLLAAVAAAAAAYSFVTFKMVNAVVQGYYNNKMKARPKSARAAVAAHAAGVVHLARLWRPSTHAKLTTAQLCCLLAAVVALCAATPLFAATWYYHSIVHEGTVQPVQVNGTTSTFTVLIMSQPRRLRTLRMAVQHYGRCPSVAGIVVVWSGGPAPHTARDLKSAVPVRVRVEEVDSLNNRFKPDPQLNTRAVMQLDDDTLLWCSDVERGFAEWRRHPDKLVGFFPRLIVAPGSHRLASKKHAAPGQPHVRYLGEREAYRRGRYNVMLTITEFLDRKLLDEYWSPRHAAARAVVDIYFNCEDILMNFVLVDYEQRQHGSQRRMPAARFVRARRRLDVSALTAVGISRNASAHLDKRQRCTVEFMRLFGVADLDPLPVAQFDWREQPAGTPLCSVPGLGCIYL